MRLTSLALLIALATPAVAAATSTMRCGSKIITTGATKLEVLDKCGEPDFREIISGADDIRTETWTYRRGPSHLVTLIVFRGAKLIRIETQNYR